MNSPMGVEDSEENKVPNQKLPEDRLPGHDPQSQYDSDTPPTAGEWKTMKGYGSFITHDEDNVAHAFSINNIIHVLPTGRDPDEEIDPSDLWLAQIRSIRAHNSNSVWIKAKWFYHPSELPDKVKGTTGKIGRFGEFERISSNQADFIPTSTCCGIAKIMRYDEQDVEQEAIESGTFYYRWEYDWQKRTLKGAAPPCSICQKSYNPDTDLMHFCPRSGCCRSWHATCLAATNWLVRSPVNFLQRLESLDRDLALSEPMTADSNPKKKARTKSSRASLPSDDPYSHIPPGLLAIARQPIVRGGNLGVVGNVRSVVRARKMLREALKGQEEIPVDWETRLGKILNSDVVEPCKETGKAKRKEKALAYQCPQCGEPI